LEELSRRGKRPNGLREGSQVVAKIGQIMITNNLMTGGSRGRHTPYQGTQHQGQSQLSFTHGLFLCPVINIIPISFLSCKLKAPATVAFSAPRTCSESMVTLSIIIPAFDEARKIPHDVQAAAQFLMAHDLAGEIIVVDDGSSDGTAVAAGACTVPPGVEKTVITGERHRGKGFAVRTASAHHGRVRALCR
jgi:hypothetical protein